MLAQIQDRECEWHGENDCKPWRAMLLGMAICVVVDFVAAVATTFFGKAMETSARPGIRQCALLLRTCRARCLDYRALCVDYGTLCFDCSARCFDCSSRCFDCSALCVDYSTRCVHYSAL